MVYIEALLLTILLILLGDATVSDLHSGIIKNRSIMIAFIAGIMLEIPYFLLFSKDCLLPYLVNNFISVTVSILLYATGIWGAGDSKLLVVTTLLFPARLYCIHNNSLAAVFILFSIVFITAFLYVLIDTIVVGIKQKNLFKLAKLDFNLISFLKSLFFIYLSFELFNSALFYVLPDYMLTDNSLLATIFFIETIICLQIENKINWIIVIVIGVVYIVLLLCKFIHFDLSQIKFDIYVIAAFLMVIRLVADKYNYKTVKVSELKPGMIISMGTVLLFSKSRVEGLPSFTSENLKSRITSEEVASITRWSKTPNGRDTVVVVRKIPFAVFIATGTILFTLLEVLDI